MKENEAPSERGGEDAIYSKNGSAFYAFCKILVVIAVTAAIITALFAALILTGDVTVGDTRAQERKNAAKIYSESYDEVEDYVNDCRKDYQEYDKEDRSKLEDTLAAVFTFGLSEVYDPSRFDSEDEYVLFCLHSKYGLASKKKENAKEIVGEGIVKEWGEERTVNEIANDRAKESEEWGDAIFDVLLIFFLIACAIYLIVLLIVFLCLKRAGKRSVVNVVDGTVSLNDDWPFPLSDVRKAEKKSFGTIIIYTVRGVKIRKSVSNAGEIADFINARIGAPPSFPDENDNDNN